MFNRFRSFLKQPIALFCGLGYFAVVFLSFTSALPSLTLSPSWSEFYDFENSAGKVYDIQVSPGDVAALYVYVDRGLYKSIDYGQNFTNIFTTVHDARLLVIDNFRLVITTYNGLFYSADAGQNWQQVSYRQTGELSYDAENEIIYFGQVTGNCFWDRNYCGIFKFDLNSLEKTQLKYAVSKNAFYVPDPGVILGWWGRNYWRSTDNGLTWTEHELMLDPSEEDSGLVNMIYSPPLVDGVSGTTYALNTYRKDSQWHSRVLESVDSGLSWSITGAVLDNMRALRLYLHDGKFYLLGGPGQGIYVSYDKGQSWETFNNGLGNGDIPTIYSLGFGSDNFYQDVIYAGDYQGKLYRTGSNPKYDPVIFIHGLGGSPNDWVTCKGATPVGGRPHTYSGDCVPGDKHMHFDALLDAGYPENYLNTYTYADIDGNPDTYDNQGDVTLIAADLDEQVDGLSQMSFAEGGSGKVDLVGFSLGGLVARQYLNTFGEDKVDQLITIGTPHLGAEVLSPLSFSDRVPFVGGFVRDALTNFANSFLKLVKFTGELAVDLTSDAVVQVTPKSSFLNLLNQQTLGMGNVNAAYGDIDFRLKQRIFFWDLYSANFSLGDGYISTESATSIPVDNQTHLNIEGFSDDSIVDLDMNLIKSIDGSGYKYELDVLGFDDLKFRHGNLVKQPEVVNFVISALTGN